MTAVSGSVEYGTLCDLDSTVAVPSGATTYTWTLDAPFAGMWNYIADWFNGAGARVDHWQQSDRGTTETTWTKWGAVPTGAATVCLRIWWGYGNSSPGGFTGSIDFTSYCQYGTEANPDAIYYEVVTDSLIDLVVGAALAGTGLAYLIPYVETALAAVEGGVAFGVDCSTLPGSGPVLDFPNLSTLSTETLREWFQNAAWRFFCRCTPAPPGSDDPIPPPPPSIIPPVTVVGAQPVPVCDNADLCAYLLAMKEQLQTITAQLGYLRTDVRLIKNQHVPFGYVLGTLHSGLTGAGSLAVSGILGVSVELTTIPGSSGVEEGDPLALFGLGWITLGNADGWRLSTPLRHNPMWIDAAFSDTLVGYSFAPLVVADIREISRQP